MKRKRSHTTSSSAALRDDGRAGRPRRSVDHARTALGASPGRIVAQMFAEALVLGIVAALRFAPGA